MLVRIAEKIIYGVGGILGSACMALGLSPNAITVFGMAAMFVAGVLFGMGCFTAGGLVLFGACLFDSVDGLVARKTGRVTKFGAFFDSTLDRYSDLVVYGGLLVFAVREPANREWLAAPVAVIISAVAGAFLVSYTKARGDDMVGGISQGYWGRVERLIMLIIGVTVWRAGAALWILAVFPHITVLHRILIVRAKLILTGRENPQKADEGKGGRRPWAKLSQDGSKVIFPLPLRILFIDYRRGSVPYDIACAVFILADSLIPIEWVAALNRLVIQYLG